MRRAYPPSVTQVIPCHTNTCPEDVFRTRHSRDTIQRLCARSLHTKPPIRRPWERPCILAGIIETKVLCKGKFGAILIRTPFPRRQYDPQAVHRLLFNSLGAMKVLLNVTGLFSGFVSHARGVFRSRLLLTQSIYCGILAVRRDYIVYFRIKGSLSGSTSVSRKVQSHEY
jgi:hypothetical protein